MKPLPTPTYSETATLLAKQYRATGNPDIIPILGDRLEEDGVEDVELLTACRERKLWAVSRVLHEHSRANAERNWDMLDLPWRDYLDIKNLNWKPISPNAPKFNYYIRQEFQLLFPSQQIVISSTTD